MAQLDQLKTLRGELDNFLHQLNPDQECDLVTQRSRKLTLVADLMAHLKLKWNHIFHLFKTHSYVHPEIAKRLKTGDDEVDSLLAQGFVRNEKLVRILKNASNAEEFLAVDGLMGNLTHGPNFEYKYYLSNLKHGYPKSPFDEDPDYKYAHVKAVRQMYRELDQVTSQPSKQVYNILRQIYNEVIGLELPRGMEMQETLPPEVAEKCKSMYVAEIDRDSMEEFSKNIKWRGEKRNGDEESTPASKIVKED